jgi:hypothetical protein
LSSRVAPLEQTILSLATSLLLVILIYAGKYSWDGVGGDEKLDQIFF